MNMTQAELIQQLDCSKVDKLSDRQLEIFDLMGQGFTTKQIAARLQNSTKTIETHKESMKAKLDVRSTWENCNGWPSSSNW